MSEQCVVVFQVELLGFPAHTTHILQPLDVGIFGPLKRKYREMGISAGRASTDSTIGRSLFPTTWATCKRTVLSQALIKSSFKRTGLWPRDIEALDWSKVRKR